jgi:hypothetical protein
MAKSTKTAKSAVTAEDVAAAFAHAISLANKYNGADAPAAEPEEDVEDVEDADEEEVEVPDRETVAGMGIKDLRELAKSLGIEETKKADILEALEEFYEDEEEDEDDEVEDVEDEEDEDEDEADEEEDEEGEYDRDELAELDLKELRALAKQEGHSASEYRGMDQDALIDLILGEEAEEEEEDEEDDEDEEVLDEDALNEMSEKELLALAKELGLTVPKKVRELKGKKKHNALVTLILDSGEEE